MYFADRQTGIPAVDLYDILMVNQSTVCGQTGKEKGKITAAVANTAALKITENRVVVIVP